MEYITNEEFDNPDIGMYEHQYTNDSSWTNGIIGGEIGDEADIVTLTNYTGNPDLSNYRLDVHVFVFDCRDCGLTALPSLTNVEILVCSGNNLTELPPLPRTLRILICENNQLTRMPQLPDAITLIRFSGNPIYNTLRTLFPTTINLLSTRRLSARTHKRIQRANQIFKFPSDYLTNNPIRRTLSKYARKRLEQTAKREYHPSRIELAAEALNPSNNSDPSPKELKSMLRTIDNRYKIISKSIKNNKSIRKSKSKSK